MSNQSEDTRRRRRSAARRTSSDVAKRRQCPTCQRKAALSAPLRDVNPFGSVTHRTCRFCGQVVEFITEYELFHPGEVTYRTEYRPPLMRRKRRTSDA